MSDLKEKIAAVLRDEADWDELEGLYCAERLADSILAIPEIAEALAAMSVIAETGVIIEKTPGGYTKRLVKSLGHSITVHRD